MIDLNNVRCTQLYSYGSLVNDDNYVSVHSDLTNTKNLDRILLKKEEMADTLFTHLDKNKNSECIFLKNCFEHIELPKYFNNRPFYVSLVNNADYEGAKEFLDDYLIWLFEVNKFKSACKRLNLCKKIVFNYDDKKSSCITLNIEYYTTSVEDYNSYSVISGTTVLHRANKLLDQFIEFLSDTSYYNIVQPEDKYEMDMYINDLKVHLFKERATKDEVQLFARYCITNLLPMVLDSIGGNL